MLQSKNNKSYAYSEVPLAAPFEFCGCKLLRGETSALCCMSGELLIDRAKVDNPSTRQTTRTDDNPEALEALLCKKLGQYSRELNKMFGLEQLYRYGTVLCRSLESESLESRVNGEARQPPRLTVLCGLSGAFRATLNNTCLRQCVCARA